VPRRSRLSVPLALACALLALAPAPAARAQDAAALVARLNAQMRHAGPAAGAYVLDLTSGRQLFAWRPDAPRSPASVEKLYTTSTALLKLGPDTTLGTTVLGQGTLAPDGTWQGDLYLKGGGDPTLSADRVGALATQLEATGVTRVSGSILGDESMFDSSRGSYDTTFAYDPDIGGVLGALTIGRGFSADGQPALAAAKRLAADLRADGVRVIGRTGTGTAPASAQPLATTASAPIRELIALTNVPSDNYLAETLLKDLGARFGGAGTTAAGVGVVQAQMAALGLHPRIVDGSGLSRADLTTPRQVVRLLARMHAQPLAGAFEGSLPVAGRTGTLVHRMRGTAAQDRCEAKTGTLIGVSSLAGLCSSAGGHVLAFAFLMNRVGQTPAHRAQDAMTAALATYSGA
jgi:D-alanyl-D-alanine carboxypeptidase/D-alanyl-D-alanine-endopeptidase (penicillin-binding protein 4)